TVEGVPATYDQLAHAVRALQCVELCDVGAGDEACALERMNHQTGGWVSFEVVEGRSQFRQHIARQAVHRGIGTVETQPGYAGFIDMALEVPQCEFGGCRHVRLPGS